jgi:hypothetical protein
MSTSDINIDNLIDDLAEKFLLLDWDDKKQLEDIHYLLTQLPDGESYQGLLSTTRDEIKKIMDLSDPPDSDTRKIVGDLLEKLHSTIVKESVVDDEPEGDMEFDIDDDDMELYDIFIMEVKEILGNVEGDVLNL